MPMQIYFFASKPPRDSVIKFPKKRGEKNLPRPKDVLIPAKTLTRVRGEKVPGVKLASDKIAHNDLVRI